MQNFKKVLRFTLTRRESFSELLATVISRMTGMDPWTKTVLDPELRNDRELYTQFWQDVQNTKGHWKEIADVVQVVTLYDTEKAVDWWTMAANACLPIQQCAPGLDPTEESIIAHNKVFGCFLGILYSIAWLDENKPDWKHDENTILDILSPFLLEEGSYLIDYSNNGFMSSKDAKEYRQALSDIMEEVVNAKHFARFKLLIKSLTELGEETLSNNYFQGEFLSEANYAVFKSLSSVDQANVLLYGANIIDKARDAYQQQNRTNRMRIFICDDDEAARAGITAILTELGHEVLFGAFNKQSTMSAYDLAYPDVAIIDTRVPNEDSCETIKAIMQIYPNAKIIACGNNITGEEEEARKAGAKAYISKPLDAETMTKALLEISGMA